MKTYRGFKEPIIDETHWKLGSSGVWPIKNPTGNWGDPLPDREYQRKKFDTDNCTGHGWLSAIEMYMFKVYGLTVNYSDRWLGTIAGTGDGGNDPHTVAEAIRKYGLVPEYMMPFSPDLKNIDEYYSFKGVDEAACRAMGQKWLEIWSFNHDWVFEPSDDLTPEEKRNRIKEELFVSPVPLSVRAWDEENGIYVKDKGVKDNHWTAEYDQKVYNYIFDTYDPIEKKLDIDYDFKYAKRFKIEKKGEPENEQQMLVAQMLDFIVKLLKSLGLRK